MATKEQQAPLSYPPEETALGVHLHLVPTPEDDEWTAVARTMAIEPLAKEDDEGQTHVINRFGEVIGAAGVFTRSVPLGLDNEVHAVEIEIFATNEAYYHSAYLALLNSVIEGDPRLTEINGAPGPEMAAVAADIRHHLPLGWLCEYSLVGGPNNVEVRTHSPDSLAAHILNGGKVEHSFKKLASAEELTTT